MAPNPGVSYKPQPKDVAFMMRPQPITAASPVRITESSQHEGKEAEMETDSDETPLQESHQKVRMCPGCRRVMIGNTLPDAWFRPISPDDGEDALMHGILGKLGYEPPEEGLDSTSTYLRDLAEAAIEHIDKHLSLDHSIPSRHLALCETYLCMLMDLLEIGDGGTTTSPTIGELMAADTQPGHVVSCPYYRVPKAEMGVRYDEWFSLIGSQSNTNSDAATEHPRPLDKETGCESKTGQ